MPTELIKDNVFKYSSQKKEISLYCCEAFTLFEKSFRKVRQIYLTDHAIYIISRKKLKLRIPLNTITKVYVGLLAGEFFLVNNLRNLIMDCAEGRTKFIENIRQFSPECHIQYVNYTMLDFLFEKHKKINNKVKLTEYDPNEKKVQLKYTTGQKLNLKQLREKWEQKSMNSALTFQKKQTDYELTQLILTNTYWNIFAAKQKSNNKNWTIKIYPKKFIGVQETLLQSILNQRRFLEFLTTLYTPNLAKAFYSASNIYLVFDSFNGYPLEIFSFIKKHKIPNLLSQIIIAIGQLHEAGLVYGNLSRNGIFITLEGYVFLVNMGLSVEKEHILTPLLNMTPPQAQQSSQANFGWDWWNLAQLIFEIVQKRPFYENMAQNQVKQFLKNPSDQLPSWLNMIKWKGQDDLLNLFQLLLKKNPKERLGYKKDYHEILHHKYFEDWLKEHPKTEIMKRKCPPVFKKVAKPKVDKKELQKIDKEFIADEDWSQMNGYLKEFEYARDVE